MTSWVNTLYLDADQEEENTAKPKLTVQVGSQTFTAALEDNDTTHALLEHRKHE